MKNSKLWSTIAITAIILTILVPVLNHFNNVQNVQAASSTWTKNSSNPVISSGDGTFNGTPAVILDGTTYKMWYIETTVGSGVDTYIDGVAGQTLGNLIIDLEAGDFTSIAANDSQNIKNIINYLSTANINAIVNSIQTTVKYATSTDRVTWTPGGTVTFTAGSWDPLVSSLNVIKDSTSSSYKMWYTGYKIDTTTLANLLDALNDLSADDIKYIFGDLVDRDISGLKNYINESDNPTVYSNVIDILADLLYFADASKPAIGYATSTDGLVWSKNSGNPILTSLNVDWDSQGVMTPSVIKNSDTSYDMWYSGVNITIDLDDLFGATSLDSLETVFLDSIDYSICHAASTDGISWTSPTRSLTESSSGWTSYGVFAPSVVKTGSSTWEMYFTGMQFVPRSFFDFLQGPATLTISELLDSGTNMAIGYATSSNGTDWTPQAQVLSKDTGEWDEHGVGYPSVVQNGTNLYLWYTGSQTSPIDSLVSILQGSGIGTVLAGNQAAIGMAVPTTNTTTTTSSTTSSGGGGGGGGGGSGGLTIPVTLTGLTPADNLKVNKLGLLSDAVQLTTVDGKCTLTIAAQTYLMNKYTEALTSVSVAPMTALPKSPDGKTVLLAYEFTPSGALFTPTISITIKYDPSVLPAGSDPANLQIGYWNGTTWYITKAVVNTSASTITFSTNHFSAFAVIYPAVINLVTTTTTTTTTAVPVTTTTITTSTTTTKPIPVPSTTTKRTTTTTQTIITTTTTPLADVFALDRLSVSPTEVHIGGYVTIAVWVNNSGTVPGSYRLDLKIDDADVDSRVIWVEAGTPTEVTFDIVQDTVGEHTVDINGQTTTFTVLENAALAPKNNIVLIIVIGSSVFVITLIITAILSWRRSKRYGYYRK